MKPSSYGRWLARCSSGQTSTAQSCPEIDKRRPKH